MVSVEAYLRRGKSLLRRWAVNPRLYGLGKGALCALTGFCLSAAALANMAQPLALSLVCACSGWSAVLMALGGAAGYWLFWGTAAYQPLIWLTAGLAVSVLLTDRRVSRAVPLLLPSVTGLIVAAVGVLFQTTWGEAAPIQIYLLRILLGAGATWIFARIRESRDPILEWIACALLVLGLAQIVPIPYLGLGYVALGALTVSAAFPGAALAGLALDLAGITPVPMTAVPVLAFLLRLLPKTPEKLRALWPVFMYLPIMYLCKHWDLMPLPGLLVGGLIGLWLPGPGKTARRRGETGVAQVRLELVAGVLSQTEQLLQEVEPAPVDEDALVTRAAEQACAGCPCRKNCKDSKRIAQLPGALLHKQLITPEELPIICRKSGRFLAQLHRSQEQLRSIHADRERQREYREAVVQQYRFLSEYLQELSDQLVKRTDQLQPAYMPRVRVWGNRQQVENGDQCAYFSGPLGRYFVILCDGMGTGLGAVQEGKEAVRMLQHLLSAGFPPEHALQSLNNFCALRERAGAVTVDLVALELQSGKGRLYKWGGAPSYLVSRVAAERLGSASPPPGLSVGDGQVLSMGLSMRRGEILVLVSDGMGEAETMRCCMRAVGGTPEMLVADMMNYAQLDGQDDATVMTIQLQ